MGELEAKLRVSIAGKDELEQFFSKSGSASKRFAEQVGGDFKRAGSEIASFAANAARGLGALSGLGGAYGIVQGTKSALELRDAITGLASVAGIGADKIDGLKAKIFAASTATNQFGKDATESLNAFVAKTGDLETGVKNLELYGKTATATRSAMSDIANIGADLRKLNIVGDQTSAFAILAKQSDVGAVELKDLVSQGPRLLSAFQTAGLTGEKGLREGGALAQVFQMGTGNVERTSTSVEAAFRDIASRKDIIEGAGIKVAGRDRVEVLMDIIRKAKGDEFALRENRSGGIFGDEAFRGVAVLANEYKATGGFGTFEKFRDVAGDASIIDQKYKLNTSSGLAKIKAAQIAKEQGDESNFGGLGEWAAEHAGGAVGAYNFLAGNPLVAGAGYLGLKALGPSVGRLLSRGGGGAAGAAGAAVLGGGGGMPVMVTNWPDSLGGSGNDLGKTIGESVTRAATGGLGLGTGGLIAVGAGVAGSLAALTLATGQLNAAMPQIRDELQQQLETHAAAASQQAQDNGRSEVELGIRTFGRFGGRITASQAAAARKGFGSYGMGAGDVLSEFDQQQQTLRFLARSEKGGVSEDQMRENGYGFLLRTLSATNPEFANAKTGAAKAAILEKLANGNEDEMVNGPAKATAGAAAAAGPGFLDNSLSFFGLTGAAQAAGGDLSQLGGILKDALGITVQININGDDVEATSPTGTRSPKVMFKRTAAGP